jgi:hypothetical protein
MATFKADIVDGCFVVEGIADAWCWKSVFGAEKEKRQRTRADQDQLPQALTSLYRSGTVNKQLN